jgi:DNA-binding NtrC family response regulator
VHLPPLRDRREDVPLLVAHFIKKLSAEVGRTVKGVSPEALQVLEQYHWPGNIRELENVIERAIVLGSSEQLEADALPANLRERRDRHDVPLELPMEGLDLEAVLDRIEHRYMQLALERVGGVQTRAAELLRVSFRQFRYKLQKFQQRRPDQPK